MEKRSKISNLKYKTKSSKRGIKRKRRRKRKEKLRNMSFRKEI
jgi:hypothetical protein